MPIVEVLLPGRVAAAWEFAGGRVVTFPAGRNHGRVAIAVERASGVQPRRSAV